LDIQIFPFRPPAQQKKPSAGSKLLRGDSGLAIKKRQLAALPFPGD